MDTHSPPPGPPDYEALYRETTPSVVSLYPNTDRPRGAGSGFVYDDAGHVVTNEHVVGRVATDGSADADAVDVRFADGSWRVGRVVGTDAYTDLAVVRIDDFPDDPLPGDARPLRVAESNPAPGTPVAALGNPMGLDGSISAGIVSGANRSMPTRQGFSIPDVVQTDAPINPGNSGGPLVTTAGEVVGVNRARGGDNIGFAVSADVVRRVVPDLVANGEYRHSYLKIRTLDVSPTIADANRLADPRGLLVVDVAVGPSEGALLGSTATRTVRGRELPVGGDVITRIDDHDVGSHEELMRYLLLETRPGDSVRLELVRDGRDQTETITLTERPPARRQQDRRGRRQQGRSGGYDIPIE